MKNKSSTVWLVLDSRHFGGIETHVLELAKGLLKLGIEAEVVFLADYGFHPLIQQLQRHGIKYRQLNNGFISLFCARFAEKPLIVHGHGYKANIAVKCLKYFSMQTTICTYHAGEALSGKLAAYDFIDRCSASIADVVIAVSDEINKKVRGEAKVINNFVAVKPQSYPGKQVAFVGRLSDEKGPQDFIRLAQHFSQQSFHIYGDGPLLESLAFSAPTNLIFHGYQIDMNDHWQDIGLLVMPSKFEGLPMAALEAMSHGIPVCAYDVGRLNNLINHESGWLVPAGNFKQLKNCVSKWLSSSLTEHFHRTRCARKAVIKGFSDDVVIPQVVSSYNQALINNNVGVSIVLNRETAKQRPSYGSV
ncbi:glycosyltransferase family 4 protein [Psychrobium sp. 1_MG-2023]|uniref:glycosyltransferase family 4 protein n=1 Tax=Psychrobium sp. 1_MG-2023 TaxID=3062624 RepID=UPI000C333DEB|nr:glycosyltransferase family 4 protein [Psychrobium sp. 1_MG-2023]MDP2561324.1 glycosyltransferase family 4 protein [Psychrobium sp. 1_MG-2023]PKF54138.1 glycosyltransferase family 1 protein [Alteromonadales bacterium alter-6D02]